MEIYEILFESMVKNLIILKNLFYLVLDNVVRLFLGFVISVFIARNLGASKFGEINYVLALISILQVIVLGGFDSIILKDIGMRTCPISLLYGTVIRIRFIISFVCYVLGGFLFYFVLNRSIINLYFILGIQLFLYSFYIHKLYFQVHSLNRYTVIAQQASFIFISVCKIVVVLFSTDVFFLSICLTLGTMLEVCILHYNFIKSEKISYSDYIQSFDPSYAKRLIKASFPLLLQNCAIVLFMKIDQIMIGKMMTTSDVGIYSIGVTISEMIYFVPMMIYNAFYPKLIELKRLGKDYFNLLVKIGSINLAISIVFVICCNFVVPYLIKNLYGFAYEGAINVIRIHSFASLFVAIGVAHDYYLVAENKQIYSMFSSVLACILNVILNVLFIKTHGMAGAAFATLITQFFVCYFFYAFLRDRETFILRTRSLFFLLR